MLASMAEVMWEGRTALVTGASSGLGAEFARQIANRGGSVVLLARSEGKLNELANALGKNGKGRAEILVADLSLPGEAARVVQELAARDIVIEHLINNAGVGRAKSMAKDDVSFLLNMVQVNCTALTALTSLFLPAMVKRGSGGIIQVASVLAFSPCPYQATYAATKAFVKSLTEGLAIELEGTGVRTTAVCPGHVQTGFQVAAGFGEGALSVPGELSAEKTVTLALRAYERGNTVVVTGFMNRLSVFFGGLLPRSWVARISASVLRKMGRFD